MDRVQGMGAIVADGGVGFRVWAPHADAVEVIGDFSDGEAGDLAAGSGVALASEDDGYWYGYVDGAGPGQQYSFVITNGDRRIERIDPYAAEVTNSVGKGVIYDHAAFEWEGDDFTPPLLNELVIYELHAGTFAAKKDGEVAGLEAVASRFDHLLKLGVNAIQLMPVA